MTHKDKHKLFTVQYYSTVFCPLVGYVNVKTLHSHIYKEFTDTFLNNLDIVAINYWIGNWLLMFKYVGQINITVKNESWVL